MSRLAFCSLHNSSTCGCYVKAPRVTPAMVRRLRRALSSPIWDPMARREDTTNAAIDAWAARENKRTS